MNRLPAFCWVLLLVFTPVTTEAQAQDPTDLLLRALTELGKITEQNQSLKSSVVELSGRLDAMEAAPPPALPIGSVVVSLLSPVAFAEVAGESDSLNRTRTRWVLADGSDVSGSRFSELTGRNNIPDLRGMFLRGKNNNRSDGKQNPGGDLTLGEYQDDQFEKHAHEYNRGGEGGNELYSAQAGRNLGIPRGSTNYIVRGKYGPETRARNVTVNYFIRVD